MRISSPRMFFALFWVLLISCAPHVELSAPTAQAPLPDRLDAYERLRPVGYERVTTYITSTSGGSSKQTRHYLALADGTVVRHLEDLLSVVSPESATGQWASKASKHSNRKFWMRLSSTAAAIGLVAVFLSTGAPFFRGEGSAPGQIAFWGLTAAGLGVGIGAYIEDLRLDEARDAAFLNFDESLRGYLGLCKRKKKVMGCEELSLPPPPQAP